MGLVCVCTHEYMNIMLLQLFVVAHSNEGTATDVDDVEA